jgi:hypothetical protein
VGLAKQALPDGYTIMLFLYLIRLRASSTLSIIKKPVPFETGFTSSGSWTIFEHFITFHNISFVL